MKVGKQALLGLVAVVLLLPGLCFFAFGGLITLGSLSDSQSNYGLGGFGLYFLLPIGGSGIGVALRLFWLIQKRVDDDE